MANLAGFDASQVPEQTDFTAIPEGQYVVIATASEMKPTKNGQGKYLQFTFEVLDGPHKRSKVWARLNLDNPSQVAVDMAQRELGAICRAVGVIKPQDSADLHNKPLLITVCVEVDDRKREGNVIKKYEAINMQQPPVMGQAQTQAPAATPWGAPSAQAAPAAPAQSAPWAR